MEPDHDISLGIIATVMGLIGVVLGWGAKVYNAGKKEADIMARISSVEKEIAEIKLDVVERSTTVHRALKEDRAAFTSTLSKFEASVDKLYNLVYNADGGVKFITHPEHSKMSDDCKSSFRRDLDYIIANNRKDIEHLVDNNRTELNHIHTAIRRLESTLGGRPFASTDEL